MAKRRLRDDLKDRWKADNGFTVVKPLSKQGRKGTKKSK